MEIGISPYLAVDLMDSSGGIQILKGHKIIYLSFLSLVLNGLMY